MYTFLTKRTAFFLDQSSFSRQFYDCNQFSNHYETSIYKKHKLDRDLVFRKTIFPPKQPSIPKSIIHEK